MLIRRPWHALKRSLVFFWAVWLSLVVASNIVDALKFVGILPATVRFASGNYGAIVEVLDAAGVPTAIAGILFGGVILWESLAAVLFWRAGLTFDPQTGAGRKPAVILAFATGLGLWGAFQIACEALPSPLAYRFEGTHRLLFIETLATLLAVTLLPDD